MLRFGSGRSRPCQESRRGCPPCAASRVHSTTDAVAVSADDVGKLAPVDVTAEAREGPDGEAVHLVQDEPSKEAEAQEAVAQRQPQGCFFTSAFRHFEPLLKASQDYARHTGCRFLGSHFRSVLDIAGSSAEAEVWDAEPSSFREAVLSATPAVREFAGFLRDGDPALLEEVQNAYRYVMVESVRNAMVATLQRLEMWPPPSSPVVDEEDCSYEDVSAPLPEIAQRLYNDELRRQRDVVGVAGLCLLRQRATTASFLIDFSQEVGLALPEVPETLTMMLREFMARVAEWEPALPAATLSPTRGRKGSFCGLPPRQPDLLALQAGGWIALSVLVGPVVSTGLALCLASMEHKAVDGPALYNVPTVSRQHPEC